MVKFLLGESEGRELLAGETAPAGAVEDGARTDQLREHVLTQALAGGSGSSGLCRRISARTCIRIRKECCWECLRAVISHQHRGRAADGGWRSSLRHLRGGGGFLCIFFHKGGGSILGGRGVLRRGSAGTGWCCGSHQGSSDNPVCCCRWNIRRRQPTRPPAYGWIGGG